MTDSRKDAWERLAKARTEGDDDDYAWLDDLPEGDDLPEDPDETRAVMLKTKPEKK